MAETQSTHQQEVPQAGRPCTACKGTVEEAGYRRCRSCRAKAAVYSKRKQIKRSLAGLCYGCREKALPGRKKCQRCAEKDLAAHRNSRRMTERLCVRCGGGPLERKCKVCDECIRTKEKWDAAKRARELKGQGLCRSCKRPVDPSRPSACLKCHTRYQTLRVETKRRALAMYGGRCKWCMASDLAALTLDHIKDDGAEKRKDGRYPGSGTGYHLYCWLLRVGRQPDLQCLCFNCQWLKRIYGNRYRQEIGRMHGDGEGI